VNMMSSAPTKGAHVMIESSGSKGRIRPLAP
jgi:hypothetical protein